MVNILITSYYELKEALLSASQSLERMNCNVFYYPLFGKCNDKFSKIVDYDKDMVAYVNKMNIDVILWWYITIPFEKMEYIVKNTNKKNIFFNWDEPYNWVHSDLQKKAKLLDTVFITCEETLHKYIKNGTKKAVYLLPGYDPSIHKPLKDVTYSCDVSVCITNLYENEENYPSQFLNRRKLIDKIYNEQDKHSIKFHIYGPIWLKDVYPKSYQKFTNYSDSNNVFNTSKINLCTHVLSNKYKYVNERCILITGSGGLLLVDDVAGIRETFDETECVIMINNYDGVIEQIKEVINNYDKYTKIKENGYKKSKQFTWDNWASKIVKEM